MTYHHRDGNRRSSITIPPTAFLRVPSSTSRGANFRRALRTQLRHDTNPRIRDVSYWDVSKLWDANASERTRNVESSGKYVSMFIIFKRLEV